MVGDIVRAFSGRARARVEPVMAPAESPHEPEVVAFLSRHAALQREAGEALDELRRRSAIIAELERESEWLRGKLAEEMRARQQFEHGFLTLNCTIAAFRTHLTSIDAIVAAAVEEAKREMLRVGIDPDRTSDASNDAIEASAAALAQKFAPENQEQTGGAAA